MHRVSIYIPDMIGDTRNTELQQKCVRHTTELFNKLFGGCTLTDSYGHWQGQRENTTVISSLCEDEQLSQHYPTVERRAKAIKQVMSQDCVLVTVEHGIEAKFI